MSLKYIKTRTSSGRRTSVLIDYKKILTTDKPEKSLTVTVAKSSGRNNSGKITVRHHGGAQKRKLRIIDWKRDIADMPGKITSIEYDPNRTAFISLVVYPNGAKRYILCPKDITVGSTIIKSEKTDIKPGNSLKVVNIPESTFIHNIELFPHKGAQIVRSAGAAAQVLGKDETGKYMIVKLASGEYRKIPNDCYATIGIVGNEEWNLVNRGKAGRSRHMGERPTVRGTAMNPCDHPHGGGEGRCPVGFDAPRTPWGKRHMGVKTRKDKRASTQLIVRRRKNK